MWLQMPKSCESLGLSGVYNQVLVDGLPSSRDFYPYGPGKLSGNYDRKIFVTKGQIQFFRALKASVDKSTNFTVLKMRQSFFSMHLPIHSEKVSTTPTTWLKGSLSNLSVGHVTLPASIIDRDGDGFRDIVKTNRISFYKPMVLLQSGKTKMADNHWIEIPQ